MRRRPENKTVSRLRIWTCYQLRVPLVDISDDKKTNEMACSTLTSLEESDIRNYKSNLRQKSKRINHSRKQHRFTIPPTHKQKYLASGLSILVPGNERYQNNVHELFHRLICKLQKFNGDDELEAKTRKVVAF